MLIISKIEKNEILSLYNIHYEKSIFEQVGIFPDEYTKSKEEIESEKLKKYPNYCKYPDKAIFPENVLAGVKGKDALIKGFCFYPSPSKKMGDESGMFIPQNSEIIFWDEKERSEYLNYLLTKGKFTKKEYDESKNKKNYIDKLTKNIETIYPNNTIKQFIIPDYNKQANAQGTYLPVMIRNKGDIWFNFSHFENENKKIYVEPKWVDERGAFGKFIDEYGGFIQWGTIIGTIVVGALSGGAAWVITAEIYLEIVVGTTIAIRDIQKGDNISAAFSFLTGLLPLLKLSKGFRGIPDEVFESLSKKFEKYTLTTNSSPEQFARFYDNILDETEKSVISKLLKMDDVTKNELISSLNKITTPEIQKIIRKKLVNSGHKNIEKLMKIPFKERLWVREAGMNALLLIIYVGCKVFLNKELNDQELQKVKEYYISLPEDLKKELSLGLNDNPLETIKKIYEDFNKLPDTPINFENKK